MYSCNLNTKNLIVTTTKINLSIRIVTGSNTKIQNLIVTTTKINLSIRKPGFEYWNPFKGL